jgi:uncharacterized metal-binding protein
MINGSRCQSQIAEAGKTQKQLVKKFKDYHRNNYKTFHFKQVFEQKYDMKIIFIFD